MNLRVLVQAFSDRMWLTYIYIILTVITCIEAIFNSSLSVGASALLAFALCYFGVAGFVGSFRARRIKYYKMTDLFGIAAIAVVLSIAGLALITWSGFRIGLFGVIIAGPYWAFVGILIAILTTRKEHAL